MEQVGGGGGGGHYRGGGGFVFFVGGGVGVWGGGGGGGGVDHYRDELDLVFLGERGQAEGVTHSLTILL